MKIREFSNVPVIMLTAKGEDTDKIIGFECGALPVPPGRPLAEIQGDGPLGEPVRLPLLLGGGPRRVMVKGIKFNLENEGYQVDTGSDGEEAVDKARTGQFDLIIGTPRYTHSPTPD